MGKEEIAREVAGQHTRLMADRAKAAAKAAIEEVISARSNQALKDTFGAHLNSPDTIRHIVEAIDKSLSQQLEIVLQHPDFRKLESMWRELLEELKIAKTSIPISVEYILDAEATDVASRLNELKMLPNGWLDGNGRCLPPEFANWLLEQFESMYSSDLSVPFLYPTMEGGVQAEWSIQGHEISLEICPESHRGEWHDLNLLNGLENDLQLDLNENASWKWVVEQVRATESGIE